MFCKYCGKPLKENEICTCPEAQAEAAAGMSYSQIPPTPPQGAQPSAGAPVPPRAPHPSGSVSSGMLPKIIGLAVAIVVVIGLLAVVLLNRKTSINMKDYLQVSYSGMDTVGEADVSVDWMALESKALSKSKNLLTDSLLLESSLSVDATPTEGLSNGDTVTVTVTCDEDTAKLMKLKFVNTTVDYTVSGLAEGVQTDVFADLSVSFEGIAPDGTAVLQNNSTDSFVKGVSYSVDPAYGLSNGDTVTVTARYSEQNALEQLRVVPETTKTYTVSGLDAYISSYDQLDQDTIDQVTQQSKDVINTELLANGGNYYKAAYDKYYYGFDKSSISLTDVSLQTTYFAAAKPDTYTRYSNELVQVYKITASDEESPDGVTFYYAVGYHDFILKGDGTVSVKLTDTTDLYGNPSTDALYNEVIAPLSADYTVTQS